MQSPQAEGGTNPPPNPKGHHLHLLEGLMSPWFIPRTVSRLTMSSTMPSKVPAFGISIFAERINISAKWSSFELSEALLAGVFNFKFQTSCLLRALCLLLAGRAADVQGAVPSRLCIHINGNGGNGYCSESLGRGPPLTGKAAGRRRERIGSCHISSRFVERKTLPWNSSDITNPFMCAITNIMDQDGVLKVNQNFTFEVRDPQTAEISIKVHGKGLFGLDDYIGSCKNMLVKDLLEQGTGEIELEPKWYDLYSKDLKKKLAGKIRMHIVVGRAEPEQRIRAFIGTWNVGNSSPPEDLSAWIPQGAPYEIISIGTQECDYPPRSPYTDCGKDWLETCKTHVGSRYRVIHATSRGQMRLVVFVRDDAEKAVSHVHSGSEATGIGHVMPNKGGVCISFKFWDTGLCFVNSHFAAHDGHSEMRNSNYREIVGELRVGLQNMDLLNQFNHVFWMGDLNYRLDFTGTEERPMTPQRRFWHKKVKQIMTGEYKDLLQYDELSREKSASRVLHGFNEGDINFPPTFKMQKDSTNTYSQKRMPAWCDRVLWRSLQGSEAKLLSYTHCPTISTSDHKPVSAVLALTTHALPFTNSIDAGDDDEKRWHIRLLSLRANNLRASDINGYSDPYLSFVGPNLIQDFRSKVKYQTLNPVWNPIEDLPTIVFSTFPLQRLEKEYLMIQVLDYDYATADDTLGFTSIPLAQAVSAFKKGLPEPVFFKGEILRHGLPTGTMEGSMQLTWERNVLNKRSSKLTKKIIATTLSFKKNVSAR